MAKTTLGWNTARSNAQDLVHKAKLTRPQHFEMFQRYFHSRNSQDRKIALALLELFIKTYPDDFDSEISLEELTDWGERFCQDMWKEFGRAILAQVMRTRSMPAVWIDKIADEERAPFRKAFAIALVDLAKLKSMPLDRSLGLLEYFLDEPNADIREILVAAFGHIQKRDPERLHYYINEFENGAGSYRKALFHEIHRLHGGNPDPGAEPDA